MSDYMIDQRLAKLGRETKERRLAANRTQAETATEAGVSLATLRRLEAGQSVQLGNWLRILDALGLDTDAALQPPMGLNPMDEMRILREGQKPKRQRASRTKDSPQDPAWSWGDDQ
jgi:transcriptional regulator with XRE-family HTH domain